MGHWRDLQDCVSDVVVCTGDPQRTSGGGNKESPWRHCHYGMRGLTEPVESVAVPWVPWRWWGRGGLWPHHPYDGQHLPPSTSDWSSSFSTRLRHPTCWKEVFHTSLIPSTVQCCTIILSWQQTFSYVTDVPAMCSPGVFILCHSFTYIIYPYLNFLTMGSIKHCILSYLIFTVASITAEIWGCH